jgi:hypothetical protein
MLMKLLKFLGFFLLIFNWSFGQPTIEWQKCYGGSREDGSNYRIHQTADGGYIFTGSTKSNDSSIIGNHDTSGATTDAWVVKVDSIGNIQWQRCLGGSQNEIGIEINQVSDGGYIFVGQLFLMMAMYLEIMAKMMDGL